jgi:hypothetical protein
MFEPHLRQVDLQLFRDQHQDRGVGALAHLDVGHGQDYLPMPFNANEGIGREAIGIGRFGIAVCKRQAQAQQQPSARGDSGLQQPAPGRAIRCWRSTRAGGEGSEAIEDHH